MVIAGSNPAPVTQMKTSELHNLFMGDYLVCQACGYVVFRLGLTRGTFRIADVNRAYRSHAMHCFQWKRLIVLMHRHQTKKNYVLPMRELQQSL